MKKPKMDYLYAKYSADIEKKMKKVLKSWG